MFAGYVMTLCTEVFRAPDWVTPNEAGKLDRQNEKSPVRYLTGPLRINSLTMSYFHTGTRTIIGAEAFHCPVRDGKEWDHLAMVIRLDGLPSCDAHRIANS